MPGYETHKLFDDDVADLTPGDWWRKRRQRSRQKKAKEPFALAPGTLPTLPVIANHEFLLHVFDEMKSKGGQAPGLDGLRYDDFSRSEIAAALREVARAIRNGTYRPHPYRSVLIPKEDGTSRELRLRNITDRVVAGAIYRALVPYFEPRFLACSYGFRASPRTWTTQGEEPETRNTWRLLAELEQIVNQEQRYITVIDDVRKAFDNVNIDIVLAILERHITDLALLQLIEVVLRGGDDSKKVGIDQGSPLSPLILNILLDEIHDQPLDKEDNNPPNFRYADNLTYACKTFEKGNQTLARVRGLLDKAGLTLKGKKDGHPVVDLREETAQLLGFSLSVKNEQLHFDLGCKGLGEVGAEPEGSQCGPEPHQHGPPGHDWLDPGPRPCPPSPGRDRSTRTHPPDRGRPRLRRGRLPRRAEEGLGIGPETLEQGPQGRPSAPRGQSPQDRASRGRRRRGWLRRRHPARHCAPRRRPLAPRRSVGRGSARFLVPPDVTLM